MHKKILTQKHHNPLPSEYILPLKMFSQYLDKVVQVCYSHFVTMKTFSFQNREGDVSNDA